VDPTSALFLSVAALFIASPDDTADRAILNAYLRQSGINRSVKEFERREVPDEARVYLGPAAYITKTLIDKRIVFTFRF